MDARGVGTKGENSGNRVVDGVSAKRPKSGPVTVFPLLSPVNAEYAASADKQIDAIIGVAGRSDLMFQLAINSMKPSSKAVSQSLFNGHGSLFEVVLPCPELMRNTFISNLIALSDKIMADELKADIGTGSLEIRLNDVFDVAIRNLTEPACPAFREEEVVSIVIDAIVTVLHMIVESIKVLIDRDTSPEVTYDTIGALVDKALLASKGNSLELNFPQDGEVSVIDRNHVMDTNLRKELIVRALQFPVAEGIAAIDHKPSSNHYALALSALVWILKCIIAVDSEDTSPHEVQILGVGLALGLIGWKPGETPIYPVGADASFFSVLMKSGLDITYIIGEDDG